MQVSSFDSLLLDRTKLDYWLYPLGFLLENGRKTKEDLNAQQNLNAVLENNQNQMTSQVVSMQDAWKREQNLVIQLEKDV